MHSVLHLPAGEASKLTPLRHPRPRPHHDTHNLLEPAPAAQERRLVLRRLTGYLTA